MLCSQPFIQPHEGDFFWIWDSIFAHIFKVRGSKGGHLRVISWLNVYIRSYTLFKKSYIKPLHYWFLPCVYIYIYICCYQHERVLADYHLCLAELHWHLICYHAVRITKRRGGILPEPRQPSCSVQRGCWMVFRAWKTGLLSARLMAMASFLSVWKVRGLMARFLSSIARAHGRLDENHF